MAYLPNIVFFLALVFGIGYFARNIRKVIRNIKLGKEVAASDHTSQRWSNVFRIALGQSKMVKRPVAGLLHIIVYLGFIIINIEVLEIIIDGLLGTHRIFAALGSFYGILIGIFELLAVLVFISVIVFWIRRNVLKLQRFWKPEMTSWPKNDANFILYFEMILMTFFLIMNATDVHFQELNQGNWVSKHIAEWFRNAPETTLHLIERTAWWLHILGILIFLNFLCAGIVLLRICRSSNANGREFSQ